MNVHATNYLVHFSNVLMLVSYSVRDILWLRWFAVASVPVTLLALYFTYSRGGLLATALACGCLIALSHDRLWLLGTLGWSDYDGRAEVITPYFGASGTGQVNAVFPVTPQTGQAIPAAQASSASGYQAFSRL